MPPVRSPGRRPGTRAGIEWSAQPLGQMTDQELARRLGVNFGTVQKARAKRGIPRYDRGAVARADLLDKLGQVSDRWIARQVGIGESAVTVMRRRRGIASWQPHIDWSRVPDLGHDYDTAIAERLGCSTTTVADARHRRRIPPYREERVCGCGQRYRAKERGQRGCSTLCSQAAANAELAGVPAEMIDVRIALAALRRATRRGGER